MVYFHGDYELMVLARDEVLIPDGYVPCYRVGNNFTSQSVRHPDVGIVVRFEGANPVIVAITDISMFKGHGYTKAARPYLKNLVEILDPDIITRYPNRMDVTESLNIE